MRVCTLNLQIFRWFVPLRSAAPPPPRPITTVSCAYAFHNVHDLRDICKRERLPSGCWTVYYASMHFGVVGGRHVNRLGRFCGALRVHLRSLFLAKAPRCASRSLRLGAIIWRKIVSSSRTARERERRPPAASMPRDDSCLGDYLFYLVSVVKNMRKLKHKNTSEVASEVITHTQDGSTARARATDRSVAAVSTRRFRRSAPHMYTIRSVLGEHTHFVRSCCANIPRKSLVRMLKYRE